MSKFIKWIDGYEGLYEITVSGEVISRHGGCHRILKQSIRGKPSGYLAVSLSKNNIKKTHSIHVLVARAFIDNPKKLNDVNHKDGVKTNNNGDNLEWVTKRENILHAIKAGLMTKHGRDKRPVIAENKKTGELLRFDSLTDASKHGFRISNICACCKGIRRSHYGYKWSYLDDVKEEIQEITGWNPKKVVV